MATLNERILAAVQAGLSSREVIVSSVGCNKGSAVATLARLVKAGSITLAEDGTYNRVATADPEQAALADAPVVGQDVVLHPVAAPAADGPMHGPMHGPTAPVAAPAAPAPAPGPDAALVAAAAAAGYVLATAPGAPRAPRGASTAHRLPYVNGPGQEMSGWVVGTQTAMAGDRGLGTIREIQARPKHGEGWVRILFVEGGMVRRGPVAPATAVAAA